MENTATQIQEPEGISFFSIRTGETHYGKLEPTIAAYINSSDMGINASRGQDYGWRLAPEWVKKVRAFKKDPVKMSIITAKNDGRKPTTTQILYFMYGEQLAAFYEQQEENENPFEAAYMQAIASGASIKEAAAQSGMPEALADFRATVEGEDEDDLSGLIDDTIMEDEDEQPPVSEEPKQPEAPKQDTTVKVENDKVTAPKGDGKTSTKPKNTQQK